MVLRRRDTAACSLCTPALQVPCITKQILCIITSSATSHCPSYTNATCGSSAELVACISLLLPPLPSYLAFFRLPVLLVHHRKELMAGLQLRNKEVSTDK